MSPPEPNSDDVDDLEALAERVARLEARADLSTTAPDGSRVSLEQLLAFGLTRRQALAVLGFVAAGATTAAAVSRAVDPESSDVPSGSARGELRFAHEYDSSQEAVDDTEDGETVVFLAAHGPYEEFAIPARDGLTLTADGALVETSLEPGSTSYNELIASPTSHDDYEEGDAFGSTTDVVTDAVEVGDERIEVEDASAFEAGDLVSLHDDADEWIAYPDLDAAPPNRAEFVWIDDVDANDDVLIVRNGVTLDFDNRELRATAFDPVCSNLTVEGFELRGAYDGGTDYEERGIVLDYCHDVTVRNVSTSDVGRLSVGVRDCHDVRIANVDARRSGRYGVQAAGTSKHVRVNNLYADRMRYATQFIATRGGFGPTNGVTVSNSLATNCDHGFNVHPGAYRVSFSGCNTINSSGYRIRSPKTTVHGGQVNTGGGRAFTLEHRFSDTRISDVHVSELDDTNVATIEPSGELDGLVFDGITLSTDTFVGATAFAIADRSAGATVGDVVITGCRVPNVQEYHGFVGGSAAAFDGEIMVERCYVRGNRAMLEFEASEPDGADEALFVVRDCVQRDLADADAFRDHAHPERLVVVDNDFLDGATDEVDDALAWDGNREIDTS